MFLLVWIFHSNYVLFITVCILALWLFWKLKKCTLICAVCRGKRNFVWSHSQQIWSSSAVQTSVITDIEKRERERRTEPREDKGQSLSVWLLCLFVYQCSNAWHRCCFCARRALLCSDKWATVFGPCKGTRQHKEAVVAGRWGLGGGARGPRVRQRSVFRSPLWHQRWEAEVGRFNSCSVSSPCVLPTSCSDRGWGGGGGGRTGVNICCSACQASGAGMEHLQPVLEYWWERGGGAQGGDRRESSHPLRMAACVSISSCCSSFCLSVSVSHSPALHSPLYNPTSRENKLHSEYKMIGLVAQKFFQLFFLQVKSLLTKPEETLKYRRQLLVE